MTFHQLLQIGILVAIFLAVVLAVSGLLSLGLGILSVQLAFVRAVLGDRLPFVYGSTLFSLLALISGLLAIFLAVFGCMVKFVAGQVKNRRQFHAKRFLGLCITSSVCIPQFLIGWMGYGLMEMSQLSNLCLCGAGVSVILLVVAPVAAFVPSLPEDEDEED